MSQKNVSRRAFLRTGALGAGAAVLAACQPKVVEVEKVITREVEKVVKETIIVEGTPQVVEKTVKEVVQEVVTATPGPKERVTIHATGYGEIDQWEFTRALAAEKLPDIDFILDENPWGNSGWDSYADNVVTRIAGGEKLDVVGIAIEGMPLLAHKKVIRELDPFIAADAEARADIEDDFHPTVLKVLQWENKQMLMPQGWNNMMIWYNRALFEEKGVPFPSADWTWEDFVETSIALTDVQGTPDDVYGYSFWFSGFGMAPWYFNNDTHALTPDWKDSNMLDPKVAETLQYLKDLIWKHKVAPDPIGWDEGAQFHAGHQAMRGCGSWCRTAAKNAGFTDYGLQLFPHNAGPLRTVVGMGGFGVTTLSENPTEAWDVVKLLVSYEQQLDRAGGNEVPSRRSVAESSEFLDSFPTADGRASYESPDYAACVPSPPNFNIVDPLLMRYYTKIWNGEMEVAEAVTACHEELQMEMDKLKDSYS